MQRPAIPHERARLMAYPPRLGEGESQILHALQDVLVELKAIRRLLDQDRGNMAEAFGQPLPRGPQLTGSAQGLVRAIAQRDADDRARRTNLGKR